MPAPLMSCRFVRVDLGDTPITMNNIVVHPLSNGKVQWDFDMEWDGDCDIQLQADYIGKFGVKKLKLFGRMAIVMKPLTNELPVVSGIQYSFINLPQIDLQFTGLATVAEMSMLNDAIRGAIQGAMMSSCLPYRRLYKMSRDNNFLDTYVPPRGILRLHIEQGRGFVIEKRLLAKDDIPDVYLNVTVGAALPQSPSVWRTNTVMDDLNPKWNVSKDFLLWDQSQEIIIHAWDEDEGPLDPDDDLGEAAVGVAELLLSPHRRKELPLHYKGRETGAFVTVSCEIVEWTEDLMSLEHEASNGHVKQYDDARGFKDDTTFDELNGLLVIIINRAFDLPLDRKTANTSVKATFDGEEYDSNAVYDYPGYYDGLNPVYDSAFTIPITSRVDVSDGATICMELIDSGNGDKATVIGSTSITLGDLKECPGTTLTETRQLACGTESINRARGPSIEFRVSLCGVVVPKHQPERASNIFDHPGGLAPGSSSPTKPLPPLMLASPRSQHEDEEDGVIGALGTVQMTVLRGRGLSIEQQLFEVAIPDIYCVLKMDSNQLRTSVKYNTVTPLWDESKKFPLDDHGQIVKLEVWDMNEEQIGEGTPLGNATTTVGKLLMAGGSMDMKIQKDGRSTGIFIALKCDLVS
jgi:Ca2+-dependent lipid-binding protein